MDNIVKKATTSLDLNRNLSTCSTAVKDVLQVTIETDQGIRLLHIGSAHAEKHKEARNGSAKSGAVFRGDFDRTSSVTVVLADLHWNTPKERRCKAKYSRLPLSRIRLSRITAYLEVKIWSLF